MNCAQFEELLQQAAESPGPLHLPEAARAHAETCPRCAALLAAEEAVNAAIQRMAAVRCPDAVTERILAAASVRPARSETLLAGRFFEWLAAVLLPRPAFAAWLLLVALLGGAMWLSRLAEPHRRPLYTAAEVQKYRSGVHFALSLVFDSMKKSQQVTRKTVVREGILQPAEQSMKILLHPRKKKGAI